MSTKYLLSVTFYWESGNFGQTPEPNFENSTVDIYENIEDAINKGNELIDTVFSEFNFDRRLSKDGGFMNFPIMSAETSDKQSPIITIKIDDLRYYNLSEFLQSCIEDCKR